MDILKDLAVIIPFHAGDILWKDLLRDLKYLPEGAEIILVGPKEPDAEIYKKATEDIIATVRYVYSPKGRGIQLNTGAKSTTKSYLWFVHADTKVPRPALKALADAFVTFPLALHFFRL